MKYSRPEEKSIELMSPENMGDLISDLKAKYVNIWWDCPVELPPSSRLYSHDEQIEREHITKEMLNSFKSELRRSRGSGQELIDFVRRSAPLLMLYIKQLFDLDDRQLDTLDELGFIDTGLSFVRNAVQIDDEIERRYILQALPNVWVMNMVQLIFHKSILLTNAMSAYSLLYPYTDNLLDDPGIREHEKRVFNDRLEQIINGDQLALINDHERVVFSLVDSVLSSYNRDHEKLIRAGLQAIHDAQKRSLEIQFGEGSKDDQDTLGISIEKGGVSVVVNGCMVSDAVDQNQADFLFGYGSFLQFQDDLLDVSSDANAGIETVFSQTATRNNLDDQALRLFQYRKRIFEQDGFRKNPIPSAVRSIMQRTAELIPIAAAALAPERFSHDFLHSLEARFPVRFDFLRQERNSFDKALPKLMARLDGYSTYEWVEYADKNLREFRAENIPITSDR
jgi:hypothetical protein